MVQLIVGRRTSAIDEKPMNERAKPLMAARMTESSLKSRGKKNTITTEQRLSLGEVVARSAERDLGYNQCWPVRANMAAGDRRSV